MLREKWQLWAWGVCGPCKHQCRQGSALQVTLWDLQPSASHYWGEYVVWLSRHGVLFYFAVVSSSLQWDGSPTSEGVVSLSGLWSVPDE
jgi:hypothetical protein